MGRHGDLELPFVTGQFVYLGICAYQLGFSPELLSDRLALFFLQFFNIVLEIFEILGRFMKRLLLITEAVSLLLKLMVQLFDIVLE
jgi:hypothetical protein